MEKLKQTAENDIEIIESKYNQLIQQSTHHVQSDIYLEDQISEDEMEKLAKEKLEKLRKNEKRKTKRFYNSSLANEQAGSEDEEENQQEENTDDKELEHLVNLFDKILLVLQMDSFDELQEFYHNGDEILDFLYQDLNSKDVEIDEMKVKLEENKQHLQELKKKKKTNKEFIEEDKQGYNLACEIVHNVEEEKKFSGKIESMENTMQSVEVGFCLLLFLGICR